MEVTKPVTIATPATLQPAVFYRITALWALSEALLGGVLHALHLPGTGLFVGGAAVLCISLLAHFCPDRKAILKATVLVLLIKGILSPHTPPGAYLAVSIQGGLGYLLFQSKRYFKISCFLLGILTQLQSALQRLVVMVFMFGADLYQVAHGFVNYILKKAGFPEGEYVLYIVLAYLGLHVLMGVLVGWIAGRLPDKLKQQQVVNFPELKAGSIQELTAGKPKTGRGKKSLITLVSIVSVILIAGLYVGILSYNTAYTILLRGVLVLVLWVWVISPFLKKILLKWSHTRKTKLANELSQVLDLMPFIKLLVINCWASLSGHSLAYRLLLFPKRFIAYLLYR
ncbi:hypothetical protein WG947_12885 [Pontibacter sp. H259]|uniref:hypothetical protein n=1 Tax=Pontibacter sp. H259 TaxID=3133421 RepID=UPI0030BA37E8